MRLDARFPLPPGPASPAWWQLLRYSHAPLPFLERHAQRFGTPFTARFAGYGPFVMLTDSTAVRDVFKADPTALHSGEGNEFLSVTVGPRSVLVLDERPHARQRSVLARALRTERMHGLVDAMRLEAEQAVDRWPVGTPFRALPEMRRIALRVILRSVLGITAGGELDRFESLVEDLLGYSRSRYALVLIKVVPLAVARSPVIPYARRLRRLDRAVYDLIDLRRRDDAPRPPNILDDLLAARYDDDGLPPSDAEVRDALVTMMTAGYDTTAVALAWALEQIVPRTELVATIRAEVGGDPARAAAVAPAAGSRRSVLDAAVRESLRLRTIFPFVVRLTKVPFTAGGVTYPAGVVLCPCSHLIHRRADLYPDPERFEPQRFIDARFSPEQWLPFGGGGRTCVGMALAMTELRIILGTILSRVRLQRPPAAASHAVRRGLALAPHDDLPLIVTEALN
jgi:cytochrome P450